MFKKSKGISPFDIKINTRTPIEPKLDFFLLEHGASKAPCKSSSAQTDALPARLLKTTLQPIEARKRGRDKLVQVNCAELFSFDVEVAPIVATLSTKLLEQARLEVAQENELEAMRVQKEKLLELQEKRIAVDSKGIIEKNVKLIEENQEKAQALLQVQKQIDKLRQKLEALNVASEFALGVEEAAMQRLIPRQSPIIIEVTGKFRDWLLHAVETKNQIQHDFETRFNRFWENSHLLNISAPDILDKFTKRTSNRRSLLTASPIKAPFGGIFDQSKSIPKVPSKEVTPRGDHESRNSDKTSSNEKSNESKEKSLKDSKTPAHSIKSIDAPHSHEAETSSKHSKVSGHVSPRLEKKATNSSNSLKAGKSSSNLVALKEETALSGDQDAGQESVQEGTEPEYSADLRKVMVRPTTPSSSLFAVFGETLHSGGAEQAKLKLTSHLASGANDFNMQEKPVWPAVDVSSSNGLAFKFAHNSREKVDKKFRVFWPFVAYFNEHGILIEIQGTAKTDFRFDFARKANWEANFPLDFAKTREKEAAFALLGASAGELDRLALLEEGLLNIQFETEVLGRKFHEVSLFRTDLNTYAEIIKEDKSLAKLVCLTNLITLRPEKVILENFKHIYVSGEDLTILLKDLGALLPNHSEPLTPKMAAENWSDEVAERPPAAVAKIVEFDLKKAEEELKNIVKSSGVLKDLEEIEVSFGLKYKEKTVNLEKSVSGFVKALKALEKKNLMNFELVAIPKIIEKPPSEQPVQE